MDRPDDARDGRQELITKRQRIKPRVRIIAASGLSVESNVARVANAGVKHFLAEPTGSRPPHP